MFNQVLALLRTLPEAVYDRDARLLCGGTGTKYPAFQERSQFGDSSLISSYILYATVTGETLPLEHGMNSSLLDPARAIPVPHDARFPCAYISGVASHFDVPLEVIAMQTEAKPGIRPKWDIWMLRDEGHKEGYINDSVIAALASK